VLSLQLVVSCTLFYLVKVIAVPFYHFYHFPALALFEFVLFSFFSDRALPVCRLPACLLVILIHLTIPLHRLHDLNFASPQTITTPVCKAPICSNLSADPLPATYQSNSHCMRAVVRPLFICPRITCIVAASPSFIAVANQVAIFFPPPGLAS
jgi:hypothetical protein